MKKQVLMLLVAMMAVSTAMSQNFDFSAVAPSGQTLYYKIINGEAQVTRQFFASPYYSTYPSGDLTIPSSVSFSGTTYTVTSIGPRAFNDCTGLTSVTIGNYVTSIGDDAFMDCYGLTSVTIPNSVTSIGTNAFTACFGLTSVTIPNSVTNIGSLAFQGCTGLTSVDIPNSVTGIGNGAFNWVNNIVYSGTATGSPWGAKNVNGYVNDGLVYLDETMTTVTGYVGFANNVIIPNSVTNIGDNAFYGCTGLTSVTIPNSVTSIGTGAFRGCTGLTSVMIPNSVTSIDNNAFYWVNNIIYSGSATGSPWGAKNVNGYVNDGFVYLDETMTTVTGYVGSATNVIIPNYVTNIGDSAFMNCFNLTSVTIGNSVTSIDNGAFYNCTGLTEITSLASTAPTLGTDAFQNVPTDIPVQVPCGSLASYQSASGWDYFINILEDCGTATPTEEVNIRTCTGQTLRFEVNNLTHTATVVGYVGQCEGGLTVPAWFSIDDVRYTVTAVGPQAFQNCTGLTEVTLPVTITLVDQEAFKGCSGLLKVDMK